MLQSSRLQDLLIPPAAVVSAAPLEQILEEKRHMERIRQKYNLRDTKNMKVPTMQWEGDNRG